MCLREKLNWATMGSSFYEYTVVCRMCKSEKRGQVINMQLAHILLAVVVAFLAQFCDPKNILVNSIEKVSLASPVLSTSRSKRSTSNSKLDSIASQMRRLSSDHTLYWGRGDDDPIIVCLTRTIGLN